MVSTAIFDDWKPRLVRRAPEICRQTPTRVAAESPCSPTSLRMRHVALRLTSVLLERVLWLTASVAGIGLLFIALRPLFDTTGSAPAPRPDHAILNEELRIAVLNGAGEPQLAARMTRKARALGLDVIRDGNADSFGYLESLVIDRTGDLDQARAVAALLGIPNTIQQIDDDPYRLEDVEVIIGHDHRRLRLLDEDEGR